MSTPAPRPGSPAAQPAPRPLRVVLVTSFPADPRDPFGGVQSVSVALVRALARLGSLELHVVTLDPQARATTTSRFMDVTIHRLPQLERRILQNAVGRGRRQVSAYVTALRPDVIHAHDTYGLMVKGLPIPRVFTVHGFIYEDTRVSGKTVAGLRAAIWKIVERSGWADQPHVVSISPYVRERLSGVVRGVIHDIDNPISESFFDVERRETPGRIFCGAEISPRKNTLGLVEGFAELIRRGHDAELRLSGKVSDPKYGRRVSQRIDETGLGGRVKLLGRVPYDQIFDELATASVFALVSLEENSPMSIEEAMAAGVPVLTSNRCGMPYMVRDGESGFLVDPRDPGEIASRLDEMLGDGGLRARMSEASKRIARDRFHPEAVARRTAAVYRRAAQGSHE